MDEAQARVQKTFCGLRERTIKQAWELIESSLTGLDEPSILAFLRMAAFDLESGDLTHTIWSACFNLTKKTIWWCRGTPRRYQFEQLGVIESD